MSKTTIVVGCAIKFSLLPTAGYFQVAVLLEGTTAHCSLRIHGTDGSMSVDRGGNGTYTILGQSSGMTWLPGQWYYVEFKVVMDNASGTIEAKRDGITVVGPTGSLDTINGGTSGVCDRVGIYRYQNSWTGGSWYIDDIYIDDSTFRGDVRIDTLFANGTGASSDWTASAGSGYQCVDDAAANSDTDYVSSSTVGQKSLFTFSDISHTPGDIYGVQVTQVSRRADATLRELKPLCRIGSTNYDIGTTRPATDAYWMWSDMANVSPATSSAWTKSELNGAEFGIEVVT